MSFFSLMKSMTETAAYFLDENETAYPFSYYTVGQEGYGPFTDMPQPMALSELRNLLGVNR